MSVYAHRLVDATRLCCTDGVTLKEETMRRSRSTRPIALAVAGAIATVGLAACSDGDGGGAEGGAVTIWTSIDETAVAGIRQQLEAKAQEAGI
jgi:hypothetical protein